jgi:hypothetical protein
MVDLGQKKVDSNPPFFMLNNQIKKSLPGFPEGTEKVPQKFK